MEFTLNSTYLLLLVHSVLAIISSGHALLYKRDPRSALGWIAVCIAYPIIGSLLYYIFGINRVHTRAHLLKGEPHKRLKTDYERSDNLSTDNISPNHQDVYPSIFIDKPILAALARSSEAVTHRPLVENNTLQAFYEAKNAYSSMLDCIAQAQHSVCMTSYIFETNHTGRAFIDALSAAQKRGVDVRVLLDGVGELYSFPQAGYLLKKQGVRIARFLPPKFIPPSIHINLRNHRKLLVVDECIGFTGGMNIGDRHLHIEGNHHSGISDLHFRLEGPIISQLLAVFNEDWYFVTGDDNPRADNALADHHKVDSSEKSNAICRVVTDGPNEDIGKLLMIITGAVSLARQRVLIMTPYFLPSATLISALQSAALRGVEVTIILPENSNQPLAHWATRNMLWELLQFGVHIYYQPPPFAHSKLMLIDEDYAHIGSANLDPRSLRLNFELVVEVFDQGFILEMAKHFERIKSVSREETLDGVDSRSLLVRIRDAVAWLFSPYL